jgi:hypothetical protein
MKYAIKITFNKNGKKKIHYWGLEDRPRLHLYNGFKAYDEKAYAESWIEILKEERPIYKNAEAEIIEIN